ncbi:adenine nucleotide alpha hydrolases-like protein [Auriscalpium vulgare]|uniref:Adenine nucleotide alpha hydrolases-like protein n=1 Tax=Auriscalpium vulgare TaxID=40419 RepID=A0ACB8S3E6_9AGAM|nr:adenine nucleotide alpha hydrolases-like protein [Auriscalpium vulgare]
MSFSSMMGGLSALSLTRNSDDGARGRPKSKEDKDKQRARSSSLASRGGPDDNANVRSRSTSPFRIRRTRTRDPSPTVGALTQSDVESDSESLHGRPRSAYSVSDDEDGDSDSGDSDDDWSDDQFDPETEANTERNALVVPADLPDGGDLELADPLGEGVNVVVPPEPYFPTTLNSTSARGPRRRKSTRHNEPLSLQTSRPVFQRDRCTITLTQGDPDAVLKESGRKPRCYVVASDMSDESRYAVEWGIGTVLKDGDTMLIVNVVEDEKKTDPSVPNAADRAAKLRSQQERQGLAYILCRQATSLLQRTRLNVKISCEAWHAKNSRHMILDIVDHRDPVMLIVGSRGLGQLKGILLGSTSHYLIQRCSVPVMVARRRLKRPPRRNAHLAKHRARVSLAEAAGVERVTQRVDAEVAHLREEIEREEDREEERMRVRREREDGEEGEEEGVAETEVEGEGHGRAPVERKPTLELAR